MPHHSVSLRGRKIITLGFGTVLGCFDAVLADRPSVEAGLNIVSKWSSRFACRMKHEDVEFCHLRVSI